MATKKKWFYSTYCLCAYMKYEIVCSILFQSHTYPSLDYFLFGSMSFITGLLCLRLPETLNQQMAETVADLDKIRPVHRLTVKEKDLADDKIKLLEDEIVANDQGSNYEGV